MTDEAYVTIWLGLGATFVAALVNIIAGHLKNQSEHRRELAKLAKELALADLADARARNDLDESHKVRPTSTYVWYYYWFLRIIDNKPFKKKRISAHLDQYGELIDLYENHDSHQIKPNDSVSRQKISSDDEVDPVTVQQSS